MSLVQSMESNHLLGQVALVTGASRGIGRAIAEHLAQLGVCVIGTATSQSGADQITEYLNNIYSAGTTLTVAGAKPSGQGRVLQVNDPSACDALIESITKDHGGIQILVNNAGITKDQLAMRMKDDDWSAVIDTNLTAVFRLSRLVMRPMMKARYGRIVNITSVVGSMGNAGQANYSAAKAGVAGMTRALARELGSRNITVNCVAPGFIETDMTRALPQAQVDQLTGQIALGRFGQPQDIAGAVGFLVGSAASYITGVTLHVNGGMYMSG
jgi:3-oxoacyl-[acyl-carrier protein] reductase